MNDIQDTEIDAEQLIQDEIEDEVFDGADESIIRQKYGLDLPQWVESDYCFINPEE